MSEDGRTTPQVSCVLVSYRSKDVIGRSLAPLESGVESGSLDCLVVDNDSQDGIIEMLRAGYAWVRALDSGGNLGFGRACNLGFEQTSSPYILLLNPDARIEVADIDELVQFMETHVEAGIVGPAVIDLEGSPQWIGGLPTTKSVFMGNLMPSRVMRNRKRLAPGQSAVKTDYVSGSVMMIRRKMLDQIGGFDPMFFLYFEETDLCRRALDGGWEIWAHGGAKASHEAAASAAQENTTMYQGCLPEHFFRSRFYYLVKHEGWTKSVVSELLDYCFSVTRLSIRWLLRRPTGQLLVRLRSPMLAFPRFKDD